LVAQNFACFDNKGCINKISFSFQIVELFTLHLVVYLISLLNSGIQTNPDQRIKMCSKKIRKNVVFESCASLTNRLYRMSQNNGDYLR